MKTEKKIWMYRIVLFLAITLLSLPLSASAAEKVNMTVKKKITAQNGERYRLLLPGVEGEVKWSSSKSSVATVNKKGLVKTRKKGKTVITAQVGEDVYQCRVKVKQPVTKLSLNHSVLVVKQGKTAMLQASVKPSNASDKTLVWSSSNPDVASVDTQGNVKGKRSGTAVVTARAKDGSGAKASCRITVTSVSMKMKKTSVTLEEGQSIRLRVKGSAGMPVAWGSSNKAVATVSGNGTVRAVGKGTASIAAYRADNRQTVYCKVTVKEASQGDSSEEEQTPQEPQVTPPSGASPKAAQFLSLLQKYSDQVERDYAQGRHWGYANSGVASTWKQAKKKNPKCNCALLARWGLRDMGIIDSTNFWGLIGGGIEYRGNVKEQLLRHCDIIPVYKTPNQLLKEGNLLPGDICTYVEYQHTNIYAGNGLWYDAGRGVNYNKSAGSFTSFGPAAAVNMSGTTIGHIIRLR
ncbi:MAG: Ig domain-containing protein [Lachnospiraceae bacterium]|uniref:Ig-like domain-containing protein n=1 Tax=Parablautia sp. Marseille-Q6255 TaxID=3039593 RepID=UPI0024BD474D|nr:Ig-like domain-containing protein [Parablautia sp. Marseille-Q6255]